MRAAFWQDISYENLLSPVADTCNVLGKDEAHRYPPAQLSKVSIGKVSMLVQRETGTNCPDDVPIPLMKRSLVLFPTQADQKSVAKPPPPEQSSW